MKGIGYTINEKAQDKNSKMGDVRITPGGKEAIRQSS
jgi:hypothetical protein